MKIKLKNRAIEILLARIADNYFIDLWHQDWEIRIGRRFFVGRRYSFCILIWNKRA